MKGRRFLSLAKRVTNRTLRPLGVELRRLRGSSGEVFPAERTHFFEALQKLEPILIDIEIDRARWKAGRVPFDENHPFVKAAASGAKDSDPRYSIRNILERYYELVQPKNCSDIVECFGGTRKFIFPVATHRPPWPWTEIYTDSTEEVGPVFVNRRIEFFPVKNTGVQHWGPVSSEKLETEVEKLARLVQSIRMNGYVPRIDQLGGHIWGYILRKGTSWVVVVEQGQHRASVLSALGFTRIPVRVMGFYDFLDVPFFPNVASGMYTSSEAEDQFKMMLEGKPIGALGHWLAETRATAVEGTAPKPSAVNYRSLNPGP